MSSSLKYTYREVLSPTLANYVQRHLDLVLALPEPGEKWRAIELREKFGEDIRQHIGTLSQKNVIEKVERVYVPGESDPEQFEQNPHAAWFWETNLRAVTRAEKIRRGKDTLPCGHRSGFKTVDVEAGRYACQFEWCDKIYNEETIRDVFF